jgi:hypothetical protein
VTDIRRVVVQRGNSFETAQVADVGPSHVRLKGGWPEGGFGSTATLVLDDLEVEGRVASSEAGEVTLRPLTPGPWPARVLRALNALIPPP